MLGALDLVPFLPDRDTAMGLLLSVPAPVRSDESIDMPEGAGYRFTTDDLNTLRAAKRSDLADLILRSTSDARLLEDASSENITASTARAICRNPKTSGRVLAAFYADPRKGVKQAAIMAGAQRINVHGKYAEPIVAHLFQLTTCGDEEVTPTLLALTKGPRPVAREVVAGFALERVRPLPDDAWDLLKDIIYSGYPRSVKFVQGLVRDPRLTLEDLRALALRVQYPTSARIALEALLERRHELSPEDAVEALVRYSEHTANVPERFFDVLTNEQAMQLACAEGELGAASLAFESGKVPDSVTRKIVDELLEKLDQPGRATVLTRSVLPGGRPTRTTMALRTVTDPPASLVASLAAGGVRAASLLQVLAANTHLAMGMQEELLRTAEDSSSVSLVMEALAGNPAITVHVAQQIVDMITENVDNGKYQPWATSRVVAELMCNPSIPMAVTRQVPVRTLSGYRYTLRLGAIANYLTLELGNDPQMWREFFALLPEWEGSIGDLVDVLRAL